MWSHGARGAAVVASRGGMGTRHPVTGAPEKGGKVLISQVIGRGSPEMKRRGEEDINKGEERYRG